MGHWNQSRDDSQATSCSLRQLKQRQKLPQKEKAKNTESMNADIHLEHRASSSQGKLEGEPSLGLCDRLDRTRDNSQRQLTERIMDLSRSHACAYHTDSIVARKLLRLLLALSSCLRKENANHQNNPRQNSPS